jgi:hypothetical protein
VALSRQSAACKMSSPLCKPRSPTMRKILPIPGMTIPTLIAAAIMVSAAVGAESSQDASQVAHFRRVGADLTKPTTINFAMHVLTQESADRVAARLPELGLTDVMVEPSSRSPFWLVRARKTMLMKEADLITLRRQFNALLAPEMGGYDGWGASWTPPPHRDVR